MVLFVKYNVVYSYTEHVQHNSEKQIDKFVEHDKDFWYFVSCENFLILNAKTTIYLLHVVCWG